VSLTQQQRAAAHAAGSVAVLAGAGTGKTFLLTHRYLHHLSTGLTPLEIVAITFTNEAAGELRSRIRSAVQREYPGDVTLQAEVEVGPISTIHALCSRICQEQPELAQLPADFGLMDDVQAALWFEEHFRAEVAQLDPALLERVPFSRMLRVLEALFSDPYTAGASLLITAEQRRAVLERGRSEALRQLRGDPGFRAALTRLQGLAGPAGDKREVLRQDVIHACLQLLGSAESDDFTPHLAVLDGIDLRGGSWKAWGGRDAFNEPKAAFEFLRNNIRAALKQGVINWQWGEADEQLEAALPDVAQAFGQVRAALDASKRQQRLIGYNDLELGALRVLQDDTARREYARRWRAFMVDEFQDTNPVQIAILERLSGLTRQEPGQAEPPPATLTTVGDAKQSIYGFRRASPELSQAMAERIGHSVELNTSFRTHDGLLRQLDAVFEPLLEEMHQPLAANRPAPAGNNGHLLIRTLEKESGGPGKALLNRAEARLIARDVRRMLDDGTQVWDKRRGAYRELRSADVAVLARSWSSLQVVADALTEQGIPSVLAGGLDLLATREALDGLALLQFLANPNDEISLVALLRSPFLAISDRTLMQAALQKEREQSWWQAVAASSDTELQRAAELLSGLLREARWQKPAQLLRLADRSSGYTAVLSGLPGAERRLADWRGFVEFISRQEQAGASLFSIIRQLRTLQRLGTEVARPVLAGANAVSLMSIHASKGLEWPLVFLPDLSRGTGGGRGSPQVLFEADAGCAILLDGDPEAEADTTTVRPGLYSLLKFRQDARGAAEANRLLYVACTRAADRLVLSSVAATGGLWKPLTGALALAGLEPEVSGWTETDLEVFGAGPEPVAALPGQKLQLLDAVRQGVPSLPVTALPAYAACPKMFRYRYLDEHPGAASGSGHAARIGTLTHKALELQLDSEVELARHDPALEPGLVLEALGLARAFRTADAFSAVRERLQDGVTLEAQWSHELAGVRLQGVIDVIHPEFVLDYKTDREVRPRQHVLQLAVYAKAAGVDSALVAYLRASELHEFTAAELDRAYAEAQRVVGDINAGRFGSTPSVDACRYCSYRQICGDAVGDEADSDTALELHGILR
jgi:ATP-dependent helicase/nuclease subunit A